MRMWFQKSPYATTLLILFTCAWCAPCQGQITALAADPSRPGSDEPAKTDGWTEQRDEQAGIMVKTMEMTVTPRAEPRPALKHQLIADEFELLNGNAAIYYLKAMGFLEGTSVMVMSSLSREYTLAVSSLGRFR